MCEELNEGKVQFGFCRFRVVEVYRYVYLAWMGEGVQGLLKGNFNNHSHDMQYVFKGFHVQINARDEGDLEVDNVKKRLVTSLGANYDAGQREQGTKGGGGGAPRQVAPSGPIIDKEASERYWNEQKAKEEAKSAPQGNKPAIKADAAGLKSKFERLAEEQKPDVIPPKVSAPPPKRVTNVATPTPAPVVSAPVYHEPPQQTYEEQSYDQSYEEQTYDQPEETYEESYEEGGDDAGYATATALYDFPGENEGDLAFYAGDVITILDTSDPSGWWSGELNGAQGYFPSNFVQSN
jgi:hypothetical protein